jgi:hypothetical protein
VISDDQPDAREGQAAGAERFAVPLKPGKRRGGKGPQLFKTDAKNGQAVSIDLEKRLSDEIVGLIAECPRPPPAVWLWP